MRLEKSIYISVLICVLTSCSTKIFEYPVIYFPGREKENKAISVIDEYHFGQNCDEKLIRAIQNVAEETNSDNIIFDLNSVNCDINIIISDVEIDDILNGVLRNYKIGVVLYCLNPNENYFKNLFFICSPNNYFFLRKTKNKIKFKPLPVRLSKRVNLVYFDEITTFHGCLKNDSLYIQEYILNGKPLK